MAQVVAAGAQLTIELDVTRADDEPDASISSTAELPARIGRYLVLERIGAGGMGVVVAAYDGELDRVVAIKLLHPRASGLNAGPRLVREAQALARLSHPNVVAVYDAGTIDPRAFIAMELVRGRTLEQWLRDRTRPWREVLEMFLGAAAGLAAAHAAGIVHRDFKPANVLVDEGRPGDTRARVLDFGLALGRGEHSGPLPVVDPAHPSMLDARLTATGMIVGTPAYMAPEQLRGEPADARSDQYSFCVALWEALFGERPRYDQGDTRRSLPAIRSELLAVHSAPAALRRVLQRGLSLSPTARWPTMEALLDALGHRRRRRARASVAAIGALLAGALAWQSASGHDAGCAAASVTGWDASERGRVRDAVLGTGRGYADDTWARIEPELDAYVYEAARQDHELCRSQRESADVEPARACLDHRRAAFAAVVEVLAQTDGDSLARANAVVDGLPALAVCSDPASLAAELPMPTTPSDREQATQIREQLLTIAARKDARRFSDAIELAREQLARAQALGYAPVVAEAQLALGTLLELTGDDRGAEAELIEAAMTAKALGLDRVATIAMTRLTGAVGYRLARVEEGRAWGRHAESMVERARLDLHERAQLRNNIGAVEFRSGDYASAERTYRDTIVLVSEANAPAERQELANAHNNLGNVYARQGRLADASTELDRAVAILSQLLGPHHPTVAMALINLGNIHYDLGRFTAAAAYHRRAYAIVRDALGDEHPLVAASLGNLGLVMHRLGRDVDAQRMLEEAIALKRRLVGDEHPDVAFAMNNLGEVYRDLGRFEDALREHDAAAAIWARNDPDHPYAAFPIANRGLDLLELGRNDEALAALREALAICDARQVDPAIAGSTRFGLAKALLATGGARETSLEHARTAERIFAGLGGRYQQERARISAWLAAQGE
jgi:eukaryotic-like serine/threonine-protein kinase